MSQKLPEEIIRESRTHMEALALKIVKQTWIRRGVEINAARSAAAAKHISKELLAFLEDTASWVSLQVPASAPRVPEERPPESRVVPRSRGGGRT